MAQISVVSYLSEAQKTRGLLKVVNESLVLFHSRSRIELDDLRVYRPTPHGDVPREFKKQRNRSETLSSQLL